MARRRVDLDLYNVLLAFGWARAQGELIKATIAAGRGPAGSPAH